MVSNFSFSVSIVNYNSLWAGTGLLLSSSEILLLTMVKVKVKSLSCVRLCDWMDYSPPGSSMHRIFQARILEWVAICFQGNLRDPGIELGSPAFQADSLPSEPPRIGVNHGN